MSATIAPGATILCGEATDTPKSLGGRQSILRAKGLRDCFGPVCRGPQPADGFKLQRGEMRCALCRSYRTCTACGETKHQDCFGRQVKKLPDGSRANYKRPKCKPCHQAANVKRQKWRWKHDPAYKASKRARDSRYYRNKYRTNAEFREKRLRIVKEYKVLRQSQREEAA